MSLRVKKELERIYDGLLSMTVVCLCRVKKTGVLVASKGAACAEGVQAVAAIWHTERRGKGRAAGNVNAMNMNVRIVNDKSPQSALMIFRTFFCTRSLSIRIAQSVQSISSNTRTEFVPRTLRNESILDASIHAAAPVPFSAWRRRLVWIRKTGLDTPCATVNLARDALDESLKFCICSSCNGRMVLA